MTTKISETTNIFFHSVRSLNSSRTINKETIMTKKKILMQAAFILAAVSTAFAQGDGTAGITEATNMVTSYFDPGV